MDASRHTRTGSLIWLAWLLGLSLTKTALSQSGLPGPSPIDPYLNNAFPETPASVDVSYSQRNYFPTVSFTEPIRVVEHPNNAEILIVSKDGLGHLITNVEGASDKRLFFDIRPIMHGNPKGEGGISDLVFHPNFELPGLPGYNEVFISYWWSPDNSGTVSNDNGINGYNRVSRFTVSGDSVDINTEEVLISQYDREVWHIGMDMEFGNDGFLYIPVADETPTTCCDFSDSTQKLNGGLWSGVLRIDVDNDPSRSHPIRRQPVHPTANPLDNGSEWPASFTQGYSIPDDNPFLATDGSILEEFYSLGLRHPWTMAIDKTTGDIWVADVGRRQREEINLINKADNHQWPYMQGTLPGPIAEPASIIGNEAPPIWEYDHIPGGNAVIGAGVYRGALHPELDGKYLFSDFVRGELWAITPSGTPPYNANQIGEVTKGYGNGINSYLIDSGGRILMSRTNGAMKTGGTIEILVRNTSEGAPNNLPNTLSATGAFSDLSNMTAVDGCIDYQLNVPFWSDGANKFRWICLPNDGTHDTSSETIVFSETDPWAFPPGTVFIKHFSMNSSLNDPSSAFPIETRFLVITDSGHYGVSYQWNATGTDATLVDEFGDSMNFAQQTNSGSINRTWDFPSRDQCIQCHSDASGGALGVNTRQLNKDHLYNATSINANQLVTFDDLGMFSNHIDAASLIGSVLTLAPSDENNASLEHRARSYLDSNCAYCHNPSGVRANFDARLSTPLNDANLINGSLIDSYEIDGAVVIAPGDLNRSIAHLRAASVDNLAMPPLAKNLVDNNGVDLLEQWILSLSGTHDSDGDGIPDSTDQFPFDPDNDIDGDNISGHIDNCPFDSNPSQADSDNDGIGDVCDDIDNSADAEFSVQLMDNRFDVCIEVDQASTVTGANVQTSPCTSSPVAANQIFDFVPVDGLIDTYNMHPRHSGLCVAVENGSGSNSANILQETCSDSASQQFRIVSHGNTYAVHTGTGSGAKLLDASAALESDGVTRNLEQWTDWDKGNQRWTFFPQTTNSTDTTLPVLTLDSPANGAELSPQQMNVTGTASDDLSGVDRVLVRIQNRNATPWSYWNGSDYVNSPFWNLAQLNNDQWQVLDVDFTSTGIYRIVLRAFDNEGNHATAADNPAASFTVVATTDNNLPDITLDSPSHGDTLSPQTLDVSGTATDNESGVNRVLVRIQNRNTTPWSYWNGNTYQTNIAWITAQLDGNDNWQVPDVDFTTEGRYLIVIRAFDNNNNHARAADNPRALFTVSTNN